MLELLCRFSDDKPQELCDSIKVVQLAALAERDNG